MTSGNLLNEIYITRHYDSSIEKVWNAWIINDQVSQWWGPRGFTTTTVRKDVKSGGDWLFTMQGPDGKDYPNYIKYLEVVPFKSLVYNHGGTEEQPPMFRVSVFFSEIKGQTQMKMTMALPTAEAAENTKKHIKQMGGGTTWDRLAEFLEKTKSGKDIFVINRSFDIDPSSMYSAWTNTNEIMTWQAPKGMSGRYLDANVKPGGESFYELTGNDITMYGKAKYLELVKPTLIVYTQVFTDKTGKVNRHPLAPTFPETLKTTINFYEEAPKQTRISIQWEVVGHATKEEHETFLSAKAGMTQGWTGSLDKLEDYFINR